VSKTTQEAAGRHTTSMGLGYVELCAL